MVFLKKNRNAHISFSGIYLFYLYILISFFLSFTLISVGYGNTILFYNFIILSSVFFGFLAQISKNKIMVNIYLFISFFILFFVLGFRNYSALDDTAYIRIFNQISKNGWWYYFINNTMEPGYLILNSFISFFTDNYLYVQLITSFIPLALFYKTFKKMRNDINLPLAIFLFISILYFQILSAGLVRMFIAISIVFYSLDLIIKKEYIKYMVYILLASSFHYSALFMLILLYFAIDKSSFRKKRNKFLIFTFFLIPIIFIFISKYIVPLLGSRYTQYGIIKDFNLSIWSFSTLPILLILIYFNKNNKYVNYTIAIFGLTTIISFYDSLVSLGRLIFYTNTGLILSASFLSRELKR